MERGVPILAGVQHYEEITDKTLTILNKDGLRQSIKGDTIVFAAEYRPNIELSRVLAETPIEVHLVGDCAQPCGIPEAIRDGSRIAHTI